MRFRTVLQFISFSLLCDMTLFAVCPMPRGAPYWIWSPVEYIYTTSLPAQSVILAVGGWNSVQTKVVLTPSIQYFDIHIKDDNSLPSNVTGRTYVYHQGSGGCWRKFDTCGHCMNENVIYRVDIDLNANLIRDIVAQNPSFNLISSAESLISHELGHAIGLADVPGFDLAPCSEVTSIMFNKLEPRVTCGVLTPTLGCDVWPIHEAYPVPPGPHCQCNWYGPYCYN